MVMMNNTNNSNNNTKMILVGPAVTVPMTSSFQLCLGRWSNTVTMFARSFHEELTNRFGSDYSHSMLLNKTGAQMPREKYALVQHTFRQLNQTYVKRLHSAGSGRGAGCAGANAADATTGAASATGAGAAEQQRQAPTGSIAPVLTSHKVKVTFRDEPGEGTGVARHFYAALADAFTTMKHLPQLGNVAEDGTSRPAATTTDSTSTSSPSTGQISSRSSTAAAKSVAQKARAAVAKIGGAGATQQQQSQGQTSATTAGTTTTTSALSVSPDTQPLFYRTSKSGGFFTPIAGSNSPQRLNAFRNLGRIIGFCLQNTEIIPLPLCRHVLKFILNRPLNWFDLAFFDPSLFDSLRHIVYNEQTDAYHPSEFYEQLEMTFSVDLPSEEADGANIAVTRDNVLEYICLFVEHRLLGNHRLCLEGFVLLLDRFSEFAIFRRGRFRPLPTIMIRPADDQHLPTANTCISRLYLPIYSSKKLLKDKLSLAIKAHNFGFVWSLFSAYFYAADGTTNGLI